MNATAAKYRYGKRTARAIQKGTEVRMADGQWATITRVEQLPYAMRWRMENEDGRFLAYVEVYAGGRHATRRRNPLHNAGVGA